MISHHFNVIQHLLFELEKAFSDLWKANNIFANAHLSKIVIMKKENDEDDSLIGDTTINYATEEARSFKHILLCDK